MTRTISAGGQVLGPVEALNTKFPTKDRTFLERETVECRELSAKVVLGAVDEVGGLVVAADLSRHLRDDTSAPV